jgi:hypothetical protein
MAEYSSTWCNGYLERKADGRYEGEITVEGVNLSPIEGMYFNKDGKTFLWLKRKPLLEYDLASMVYRKRSREPRWEAYLTKVSKDCIAYKGVFALLHFRYEIVGVWDAIERESKNRINLFVERLPMNEQTIINGINERNKGDNK